MSQDFTLLFDDQHPQIAYKCPSLNQRVAAGAYSNNTWTTIDDASCNEGWFDFPFHGTGIRLHIPTSKKVESAAVLLDNKLFKPNDNGLFEASDLYDGPHTLTYGIGEVSAIPVFDYLTVTAGASTPLNGQALIVDDADPLVKYTGNWETEPPRPLSFDYSTSLYRDSAHWSSTVGDIIEFRFAGSSVAVYGIASDVTAGNITATYDIDGVLTAQDVPSGTYDTVPMAQLFHTYLTPGVHTLTINVTAISPSQRFGVDFIAYNTTEKSIRSLPGFQAIPVTNAAPEPVTASGHSNLGAILGGVLGGVAFLLGLGVLFFVLRRRESNRAVKLHSSMASFDGINASPLPQSSRVPRY